MPTKLSLVSTAPADIERSIYTIRGFRVMVDSELAALYEVTTKQLNQQVDRNLERFPEDFSFVLSSLEVEELKFQADVRRPAEGRGGRRKPPRVFTEHGVAMLSSVLRSPKALQINVEIIRAFIHIRRLLSSPGELLAQIQELAKTVKLHDDQLRAISEVLAKMLSAPPPPKSKIGFHHTMKTS